MAIGEVQATSGLERVRTVLLWVVAGTAVICGLATLMGHGDDAFVEALLWVLMIGGVLMGLTYVMHLMQRRGTTR